MTELPSVQALESIARKWRDLTERRHAHLVDLYDSGRWKRYYTQEEFLEQIRETLRALEAWKRLAPKASDALRAAE